MTKRLRLTTFLALALAAAVELSASIPAGYYKSIDGKTDADLKAALKSIIYNHTEVSSYSNLPQYFKTTDVYPNETNSSGYARWWDMYSDIPLYTNTFSGLNREHSFPKSWWGGGTNTPAYTDLNHLYPAEAAANQAKSNYPLGVVGNATFDNGISKVGTPSSSSGGATKVFEPADEYKGDFARTYFYFVTCYSNLTWASNYSWMLQQNAYPTLAAWAQTLLLQWHRADPVSQKELDRNEAVYKFQNNRNPFIDYPELAEYIWGNKKGEAFYLNNSDEPSGEPTLITPTQGMSLDFGQVALGKSGTAQLHFRGTDLTGSLELTISRYDKDMFALSDVTINTTYVNSDEGYWTTITYTPTSLGEHTSKLFITDGGLSGSIGVDLRGECLPVPTLSTITALPATNITDDSYQANWEVPSDETIDYYVVTRTRYINGATTTEELVAEDNYLVIDEFSSNESYTVQSVRLDYRSDASNVIMVEKAGVDGVLSDQPALGYRLTDGGIVFRCAQTVYNVAVYDVAGRLIRVIPVVNDYDILELPYGAYIIAAPSQRAPFRVLVK